MSDSPVPFFGIDEVAYDGRQRCRCWSAVYPPHLLDLRDDPTHGTVAHPNHGFIVHAWCRVCSPGSIPVFDRVLERRRRGEPEPGPFDEFWGEVDVDSLGRPVLGGTTIIVGGINPRPGTTGGARGG